MLIFGERGREKQVSSNFSFCLARLRALGVRQMPILCLVAKNRRRKDTKGSGTLWKPAVRKRSRRCRSAHLFAKVCTFNACVCKLKKLANTKGARKTRWQKLLLSFNAAYASINFSQNGKQKPLLSLPVAQIDSVSAAKTGGASPSPTKKSNAFCSPCLPLVLARCHSVGRGSFAVAQSAMPVSSEQANAPCLGASRDV